MASQIDITKLKQELWSRSSRRREAAIATVNALSDDDAIQAISAIFAVPASEDRRRTRRAICCFIAALIAFPIGGYISYRIQVAIGGYLWTYLGPCGGLAILQYARRQNRPFPLAAITLIDQRSDKRLTGSMLQSLIWTDPAYAPQLQHALLPLLTQMYRDDAAALSERERKMLIAQIFAKSPEVKKEALRTLDRCAVVSAIPSVERLLRRRPCSEVAAAGIECLDRLKMIRDSGCDPDSLLRASDGVGGRATLLRGADSRIEAEDGNLLRPSHD